MTAAGGGTPFAPPGRGPETAPELLTERLELTPFREEDLDELHDLFTDSDVRRFLLDDFFVSKDWVADEIEASRERFDETGCGLWSVREHGDPKIVGFVGYRPFFEPPELQLLYGFLASHWGRGLATEAADEALRFGFEVLGFDEVKAATDAPNVASMNVLERIGMRRRDRPGDLQDGTVFFCVGPAAWKAARARRNGEPDSSGTA